MGKEYKEKIRIKIALHSHARRPHKLIKFALQRYSVRQSAHNDDTATAFDMSASTSVILSVGS